MAPVTKAKHKGKALVAGATAGVVEICCTYPIEYVKTVIQLSTKQMTTSSTISMTLKDKGFFGFYRGLSSMVYFASPKAAIRFSSFEAFTGLLTGQHGEDKFNLGNAKGFVAGLGAGTAEAIFVTTPQGKEIKRHINWIFKIISSPSKYDFLKKRLRSASSTMHSEQMHPQDTEVSFMESHPSLVNMEYRVFTRACYQLYLKFLRYVITGR